MKEEFDFFSDSNNFGNKILVNNDQTPDKSICFDLNNICQEVSQCPQTVISSPHVDVDHLDYECISSNNINDYVSLQNESDSSTSGPDNYSIMFY
jgi:hypothetical protein